MSDTNNDAELGRSKKSASPAEHLAHLLSLGWSGDKPLIQKYVREHHLQKELNDWQQLNNPKQSEKG